MPTDHLSDKFAALADPTRRAILARLALGETSVTELAEPFAMSMPAVSKHLKVLERAGLIARGREAQWRPCRIELRALKDVDDWLEEYRRLWEDRLHSPDFFFSELQAKESKARSEIKNRAAAKSSCVTKRSQRPYNTTFGYSTIRPIAQEITMQ